MGIKLFSFAIGSYRPRWVAMACVLLLALLVAVPAQQAQAVNAWFDCNGTAAGGGDPCSGNISGGANWSSSDAGIDPAVWVAGNIAVFSAGTAATTTALANSGITAAGIIVEEGFVTLGGASAITIGAGTVSIASGATFSTNSSARVSASTGAVYTIHGGTLETTNPGSAGSFVDVDATIVLDGGGTLSHTAAGVLNIVQTNTTISGTGNLTKTGAGILAIASACSYTGDTIINDGTLRMRTSTNRLPTTTNVIINSPGVFDPAVSTSVRTVNGTGKITFSGSGTLSITGSGDSNIQGLISDGSVYGKINKSGAGTLTLSAANTYDGLFTLTAGTVNVTSTGKLIGAVGDVMINGGVLNLNNTAQTIENLNGAGGTINLALGHTLTSAAAAAATYSGTIAGQGAFALVNNYKLTLNGTNTYTGGTTVTGGTLELGATGSIDGDVTVTGATAFLSLLNASALDAGATLNLDASPVTGAVNLGFVGQQQIAALKLGGVAQAFGTYGAVGSGAYYQSAMFTGTGILAVPEPASFIALACGLISLVGLRRRRA